MVSYNLEYEAELSLTYLSLKKDCKITGRPIVLTDALELKHSCIEYTTRETVEIKLMDHLPEKVALLVHTPGVLPLEPMGLDEVFGILNKNAEKPFTTDNWVTNGYVDSLFHE